MSFIQNFYTSRDNNTNGNTYVGQEGRLWYNPDTNSIYVNTANIAGGTPVSLATGANIIANNVTLNTITSTSGTVALTGNLTITGNISPAAANKIGGIAPGPGVNVSNVGLLTIDSAGLPISFGDFYANVNQLSMVNANEAMYLVSNGTGNINLIGGVNFFKPNGFPPAVEPFFRAKNDGQLQILVPAEDPIEGGVEIIGSASGNYVAPGASGTMLQLTGNPNISCRLYQDSIGSYSSFVARRYNGNVASPTQVLANEDVFRINATAATNAGVGNVALAQISITALENQTTTAQGSEIGFTVTPVGSPASARVEVANITVANGVSATKFTTTGNVMANVIVSAAGPGGNIFIDCDLLPQESTCNLGSSTRPWQEAFFGPQSVTLLDSTGNSANTVVIQNNAGNVTMGTAGFQINTIGTTDAIFRIAALTGQIFSNAITAIQNTTDSANVTSGSLQSAGGAGIAKNLYVGNNIVATGNISGGNLILSNGGLISASGNITTSATFVGNVAGLLTRRMRNAGTIADAGTLTIDFATDDIVYCVWNNGLTIAGSNYTPGRVVRVMATKGTGSGTDAITFNGFTAAQTSTGITTSSYSADVTAIIEFISTTALVGGVYIKV